jgi:hypothetical protein
MTYVCHNLTEVREATENLSKAHMVPLFIDDGGAMKEMKNFRGIYNISRGWLSSVVVPYYNLVSHKQYFDSFAEAMTRLGMKYKMTLKESGDRAWADIEFEGRNLKFNKLNEEFTTGVRLMNSYDKSLGLYLVPRFTRLACTNGMIITRSEKTLSVKHHTKIVAEIEKFIETRMNDMIKKDAELQIWVSESMEDSIEWKSACKILHKLFSQPKHLEEILKGLGIGLIEVKDKKTKKSSFTYVWNNDKLKKDKLNRWDIYNSITSYLTHGEQITPHIENAFHKQAEKVLTTPLKKLPMIEVPAI